MTPARAARIRGERIKGRRQSNCKYLGKEIVVEEILNLHTKGGKAKPYQVKQVRRIILKYRLGDRDHEQ